MKRELKIKNEKNSFLFIITIIHLINNTVVILLSTIGIETNKFNNFISEKVSETKNINLELDTIKFKLNPRKLSLYLETQNPKIIYRSVSVPVKNIKVYFDFLSFLKSNPKIKKISLILEELDVTQINRLSAIIKPSNFKSLLNNKIKEGKLISEIEIFLTDEGELENFISRGSVKGLKIELLNDLIFEKVNLGFFADKSDILIKNILGDLGSIKISEGDIKLNLENGTELIQTLIQNLISKEEFYNKYSNLLKKYKNLENIKYLKANFNNSLSINLDSTYKLINYNYGIFGKLEEAKFELTKPLKTIFLKDEIKEIYLVNSNIKSVFKPESININGEGKYSLNNLDFFKINIDNNLSKDFLNLNLNFDLDKSLKLEFINYQKKQNSIANIFLDLKKQDVIEVKQLNFKEEKNSIKLNNILIKKNKLISFKKVEVDTPNNNFVIKNDKQINIKGAKFDARNLPKFLNSDSSENIFEKISKEIVIDFKNIKVPMSEKLQNFKLIGEIKKGKFIKISSKGDYGGNNFLDISMKKDKNTKKIFRNLFRFNKAVID